MKNNEYGETGDLKFPNWIERGHTQVVPMRPFLQPLHEQTQISRTIIPQPVIKPMKK